MAYRRRFGKRSYRKRGSSKRRRSSRYGRGSSQRLDRIGRRM